MIARTNLTILTTQRKMCNGRILFQTLDNRLDQDFVFSIGAQTNTRHGIVHRQTRQNTSPSFFRHCQVLLIHNHRRHRFVVCQRLEQINHRFFLKAQIARHIKFFHRLAHLQGLRKEAGIVSIGQQASRNTVQMQKLDLSLPQHGTQFLHGIPLQFQLSPRSHSKGSQLCQIPHVPKQRPVRLAVRVQEAHLQNVQFAQGRQVLGKSLHAIVADKFNVQLLQAQRVLDIEAQVRAVVAFQARIQK
mmetsp:Transcript_25743/g.60588  ORF Transcript_25743/g.60588 Transcript_25743/m.60588 type:complete len:245 (-) Transcript_25743:606-1340(-)